MKLKAFHLFLILLGALVLANLGFSVTEGFDSATPGSDDSPAEYNASGDNLGVPASQVSEGNEDLYILKSEVIPPVCPACPVMSACPRQTPCQPCPPCARCPEPAFECKKVPNYRTSDDRYLPRPVLNDFSQFGM